MTFALKVFDAVGPDAAGTTSEIFTFDTPKSKISLQWVTTNELNSVAIWLQLSLDGVNFADVVEGTAISGFVTSDDHVAVAARARLQAFPNNGPTTPTLTAFIGVEPTETAVSISQS